MNVGCIVFLACVLVIVAVFNGSTWFLSIHIHILCPLSEVLEIQCRQFSAQPSPIEKRVACSSCSEPYLKYLANHSDIILLREHWLWPFELQKLSSVIDVYFSFGVNDSRLGDTSTLHRRCGGVAILSLIHLPFRHTIDYIINAHWLYHHAPCSGLLASWKGLPLDTLYVLLSHLMLLDHRQPTQDPYVKSPLGESCFHWCSRGLRQRCWQAYLSLLAPILMTKLTWMRKSTVHETVLSIANSTLPFKTGCGKRSHNFSLLEKNTGKSPEGLLSHWIHQQKMLKEKDKMFPCLKVIPQWY